MKLFAIDANLLVYRLSEKGVQTLVWQNQAKAWTPPS
jgi:hypothetical protein